MAKESTFEKEVIKGLEAKTAKATAKQIKRLAEANIKAQINALEGSIIKKEIAIENLEEKAKKAFYATSIDAVNDGDAYLASIIKSDEAVDVAKAELDAAKALKEKLEGYLVRFESDEEAK